MYKEENKSGIYNNADFDYHNNDNNVAEGEEKTARIGKEIAIDLRKKYLKNHPEQDNDLLNNEKTSNNNYEMVNHPSHYNNYPVEVIDMMIKIFGKKETAMWCLMTAYKYRMRMGTKNIKQVMMEKDQLKTKQPDNIESVYEPLIEDFKKEQWYLKKYRELSDSN